MTVLLHRLPPGDFKITYAANFKDHNPSNGGEVQRINQLGDRHRMEGTAKLNGPQGTAYMAKVNANRGSKVRVPIEQAIGIGSPGSAVQANAAHTPGTTLRVKGVAANYIFQSGQYLSVVRAGKRYLHFVVDQVTAESNGQATLTIAPALRTSLSGNESIEVADPTIEGFLTAREGESIINGYTKSVSFTISIMEAE